MTKATIDQPTAMPTRKWIAGFFAGALGWALTTVAGSYGVDIPAFMTDAIPVASALAAAYVAREWGIEREAS